MEEGPAIDGAGAACWTGAVKIEAELQAAASNDMILLGDGMVWLFGCLVVWFGGLVWWLECLIADVEFVNVVRDKE